MGFFVIPDDDYVLANKIVINTLHILLFFNKFIMILISVQSSHNPSRTFTKLLD
ncbi:hypothetical protein SAMN05444359_1271 [Neolewinella agarilytica]|uniref:Uncharacterized protein n=1 Tax=Neolewinella agarilytica TaxID=478744 RepID=A0A1H9M3U3_9BACT|nr:hypothetical protein SAMN05444359_1271 [Neolewinella agarilytica]